MILNIIVSVINYMSQSVSKCQYCKALILSGSLNWCNYTDFQGGKITQKVTTYIRFTRNLHREENTNGLNFSKLPPSKQVFISFDFNF